MEEEGEEKTTPHHLKEQAPRRYILWLFVTRPWEIPDREDMSRTRPHKGLMR
jgi:hypothetical protein